MHVRVRFAPSPTGDLHLGGARTALFNYLFARHHKGDLILRIEDTDAERHQEQAQATFLAGLRWLGIIWDEGPDLQGPYGPYVSSQRLPIYAEQLQRLIDTETAYPCFCTREELDAQREAAQLAGKPFLYPRTCLKLSSVEVARRIADKMPHAYRFRVPAQQTLRLADMVRGTVTFSTEDIGDFLLCKPNRQPLYNFAATVDDALMKITHVIRGEEHLSNTPAQLLLYQSLGFPAPTFAHLPLLLHPSGRKLSKRDGSIDQFIHAYQERGYFSAAMVNFLALLGWSPVGEQEIFSLSELIEQFSLERVSKGGAILDTAKLAWMNGQYLRQEPTENLVAMAVPHLQKAGRIAASPDLQAVERMVILCRESLHEVGEIVEQTNFLFEEKHEESLEVEALLGDGSAKEVVQQFTQEIAALASDASAEEMRALVKRVQKATGHRGKKLFLPIRAASTGQLQGPDLPATLCCLGKEKILRRLAHHGFTPEATN